MELMNLKSLLGENPLFIFALEDEAADRFDDYSPLFIGVGKVGAAYRLTKRLSVERPSIIVNLGSAGSAIFPRGEVVCCTKFVQRDMDASLIGCKKYETPFSAEGAVLSYGLAVEGLTQGTCGTGDNFETNHTSTLYNLVDMEAYALAYVAKMEQIPFLSMKYISDGADHSAAEDWTTTVRKSADALRLEIDRLLM